jgi:hypothetical protein
MKLGGKKAWFISLVSRSRLDRRRRKAERQQEDETGVEFRIFPLFKDSWRRFYESAMKHSHIDMVGALQRDFRSHIWCLRA